MSSVSPKPEMIFRANKWSKRKGLKPLTLVIFFAKKTFIFNFIPNLSTFNKFKNISGIHQHLIDGIEIPHQISNIPLLSAL